MLRRAAAAVVACAVVSTCVACSDPGTTVVGGLTAAAVLKQLTDDIDKIIATAGEAAAAITANAGAQVQLAVDDAASQFGAQLNTLVDRLDDTRKQTINQLQDAVKQLADTAQNVLEQAAQTASDAITRLPFAKTDSRVRAFTPTSFVTGAPGSVPVAVTGDFYYAQQKGFQPSLTVGGTNYAASEDTTHDLTFDVPAAGLVAPAGSGAVSASLDLPYPQGHLLGKKTEHQTFTLRIARLPQSPVRAITLVRVQHSARTTTQQMLFPPEGQPALSVDSNKSGHDENPTFTVPAPPSGWAFDPTSVRIAELVQNGVVPQSPYPSTVNTRLIQVTAKTRFVACPLGLCSAGSGRLTFRVSYTLVRTDDVVSTTEEPLTIGWNDQLTRDVARNEWTVRAVLYDGSTLEVGSPGETSNPVVHVVDNGATVSIRTAPATGGSF